MQSNEQERPLSQQLDSFAFDVDFLLIENILAYREFYFDNKYGDEITATVDFLKLKKTHDKIGKDDFEPAELAQIRSDFALLEADFKKKYKEEKIDPETKKLQDFLTNLGLGVKTVKELLDSQTLISELVEIDETTFDQTNVSLMDKFKKLESIEGLVNQITEYLQKNPTNDFVQRKENVDKFIKLFSEEISKLRSFYEQIVNPPQQEDHDDEETTAAWKKETANVPETKTDLFKAMYKDLRDQTRRTTEAFDLPEDYEDLFEPGNRHLGYEKLNLAIQTKIKDFFTGALATGGTLFPTEEFVTGILDNKALFTNVDIESHVSPTLSQFIRGIDWDFFLEVDTFHSKTIAERTTLKNKTAEFSIEKRVESMTKFVSEFVAVSKLHHKKMGITQLAENMENHYNHSEGGIQSWILDSFYHQNEIEKQWMGKENKEKSSWLTAEYMGFLKTYITQKILYGKDKFKFDTAETKEIPFYENNVTQSFEEAKSKSSGQIGQNYAFKRKLVKAILEKIGSNQQKRDKKTYIDYNELLKALEKTIAENNRFIDQSPVFLRSLHKNINEVLVAASKSDDEKLKVELVEALGQAIKGSYGEEVFDRDKGLIEHYVKLALYELRSTLSLEIHDKNGLTSKLGPYANPRGYWEYKAANKEEQDVYEESAKFFERLFMSIDELTFTSVNLPPGSYTVVTDYTNHIKPTEYSDKKKTKPRRDSVKRWFTSLKLRSVSGNEDIYSSDELRDVINRYKDFNKMTNQSDDVLKETKVRKKSIEKLLINLGNKLAEKYGHNFTPGSDIASSIEELLNDCEDNNDLDNSIKEIATQFAFDERYVVIEVKPEGRCLGALGVNSGKDFGHGFYAIPKDSCKYLNESDPNAGIDTKMAISDVNIIGLKPEYIKYDQKAPRKNYTEFLGFAHKSLDMVLPSGGTKMNVKFLRDNWQRTKYWKKYVGKKLRRVLTSALPQLINDSFIPLEENVADTAKTDGKDTEGKNIGLQMSSQLIPLGKYWFSGVKTYMDPDVFSKIFSTSLSRNDFETGINNGEKNEPFVSGLPIPDDLRFALDQKGTFRDVLIKRFVAQIILNSFVIERGIPDVDISKTQARLFTKDSAKKVVKKFSLLNKKDWEKEGLKPEDIAILKLYIDNYFVGYADDGVVPISSEEIDTILLENGNYSLDNPEYLSLVIQGLIDEVADKK